MPSLPPYFNGKVSGVLTLSVSNITWYKNDVKSTYIEFEWNGSPEKQKLITSKYSKITYDIRTSYELFLNYISTCTLKCSIKSYENKTCANASVKNIFMVAQDYQLMKTLPLVNNGEIVGTLQLCFDLQTFDDTSFDNDIQFLKQFGIQNGTLNDKDLYNFKLLKSRNDARPVSFSSLRNNSRSKEELTSDYLMGKDMAPEEEEEALSTLRIMPSAESIVSAAEQIGIYSPSRTPLHVKDNTKMMTNIRPGIENINMIQGNSKKPCAISNKSKFKKDFVKNVHNAPVPKDDVYLHLSVFSINVYRTVKSLKNYLNSTYIVQCLKDREPCKSLKFVSRHVDDNVVKFKNATLSYRLEGCTAKGITVKAYVRLLSERNPVVLGETKQMLDWTGFSTAFGVPRYVKVPISNNNKITGHLSLSYEFSKTPTVDKFENMFFHDNVENLTDVEIPDKLQCESKNDPNSITSTIGKNKEDYRDIIPYHIDDQIYLHNRLYPEITNDVVGSPLLLDKRSKKILTKEKEIQTNFKVRHFDKSVQTLVKNCNVAVQVHNDELEDPLEQTISYDVQNIFRCTHEFTFNIEKKCNSTFDYITYQFPECVTNTLGKMITCCRMFRTYGNTNMLHLVTLPATIPLETYFYNNYKKAAILLNLHENNDYSPGKVSLLLSHLIDMANEFETSHVTKNLILNNNLSLRELSYTNIHIKIHYKRVYHTFPSPEKPVKTSHHLSHKSLKKNSKIIIDLTESDSEDNSINKTYTLLKNNDRLIEMTAEIGTQTEKYITQQCITINDDGNSVEKRTNDDRNVIEKRTEIATQTDTVAIENYVNRTKTKISQGNTVFEELTNGDTFKAKITIVCGYNLPMVKLNGETVPSAPTTYVIVEDYDENNLMTSSVVQQTNPVWNSEWTVTLRKSQLIEGKWLILGLWCKKYKNEYAGHDAKRDTRLGFVFINVCTLEYDINRTGKLYDVISETEQHHGEIKVIIDPIDAKNNVNSGVSRQINNKPIVCTITKNVDPKLKDSLKNEILGGIKIGNNFGMKTNKPRNPVTNGNEQVCQYIDLTKDSPQKLDKILPNNIIVKSCSNDGLHEFDTETISSVTSWTSSSDDILCSNNSRIVNDILSNETKMNRIKQIIQG